MNFSYTNIGKKSRYEKSILIGRMLDILSTENSILAEIEALSERIKPATNKRQEDRNSR